MSAASTATSAVPYFALDREFDAIGGSVLEAVEAVLRSGRVLGGPWIDELEAELARLASRRHSVAVSSCTDALYFALVALGIQPQDEVLIPDFSFAATASSVLRARAVPVHVDVDNGYELDLDHATSLLSSRTRALVVVDLYGRIGDPTEPERFAAEHGLLLVEDAAQALGAVRDGRPAGSIGQVSCLSFDPTKVVGAPGSGGALLTDDEEVASTARQLRLHGKSRRGQLDRLGYNAQMSSLVAAVLSVKLRHEEAWLRLRQATAATYTEALLEFDAVVPEQPLDREHVFHKYVVRVAGRDRVRDALEARGVTTMVHYPTPLSAVPFVAGAPHRGGGNRAARFAREVVSIPIHPHLYASEVERVVDALTRTLPRRT